MNLPFAMSRISSMSSCREIESGTVLRPQEVGLMASLGAWQIPVHRRPRVALMSTGDEVAEPGSPRRPGQIYDANRFTLRGLTRITVASSSIVAPWTRLRSPTTPRSSAPAGGRCSQMLRCSKQPQKKVGGRVSW